MPKGASQKLKLIYLKKILEERTDEEHSLTMQELIMALSGLGVEAERKSVYDDLESLRFLGMDIIKTNKRICGYYLASRPFELAELKLLVDSVQSSKFITRKKSNELIKKLEHLAGIHGARTLQRQVFVANRIKTMNESIYYNVDKIHTAISAGKKIAFLYFEWAVCFKGRERVIKNFRHDGKKYQISPWALTWDNENYYMVGFDQEADLIKHYRIDKMSSIELMNEDRDGQEYFKQFDMAVYSKRLFGMFGGKEETVQICFRNRLIGVVVDRFGKNISVQKEDEDHFIVRLQVEVSTQFFSWISAFGKDAKIISPWQVKMDYVEWIKKILENYPDPREVGLKEECIAESINILSGFCGNRDLPELTQKELNEKYNIMQADVMVLFGGSILCGGDVLAHAMENQIAKKYVIVGGAGHTTETLREKMHHKFPQIETTNLPEAEIFAAYLKFYYGLTADYLECNSTNCGNNITYLLELLKENGIEFQSILLAQDATMQRRMEAGLKKYIANDITVINYAVYSAKVVVKNAVLVFAEDILGMWDMERYLALLMGEIPRLTDNIDGYGPQGKGFIAHVDIPDEVEKAFHKLQKEYAGIIREANSLYASKKQVLFQ